MIYVVTVRYGKEKVAELELGDAIFPYDPKVSIKPTEFGGVLLLETTLDFDELIRILSVFPPVNVERIVPIRECCRIENLVECVHRYMRKEGPVVSVRIGRRGGMPDDLVKVLEALRRKGSPITIHVEPVSKDLVCVGVSKTGEDRFYLIRQRRISSRK